MDARLRVLGPRRGRLLGPYTIETRTGSNQTKNLSYVKTASGWANGSNSYLLEFVERTTLPPPRPPF